MNRRDLDEPWPRVLDEHRMAVLLISISCIGIAMLAAAVALLLGLNLPPE